MVHRSSQPPPSTALRVLLTPVALMVGPTNSGCRNRLSLDLLPIRPREEWKPVGKTVNQFIDVGYGFPVSQRAKPEAGSPWKVGANLHGNLYALTRFQFVCPASHAFAWVQIVGPASKDTPRWKNGLPAVRRYNINKCPSVSTFVNLAEDSGTSGIGHPKERAQNVGWLAIRVVDSRKLVIA